jgi:hypothetical protein
LNTDADDKEFARAFDEVAAQVEARYQISIGFTLDAIGNQRYSAYPNQAGAALERTRSVLAVQGFASEVFSRKVRSGPRCAQQKNWLECQPQDNNIDNLERLADWKREAVLDWVRTGVPLILDVNNGFDGRIVWSKVPEGAFYWGDNLDYTEDRWRNWMSQLKWISQLKGSGIKGITFDSWNGYTEGYAAVPSIEHGSTVVDWLMDLLEPPPWDCSHMHYVNGARTHRVYGAICKKWIELGADRGFGAPVSGELPSARGRVSYFTGGKAIYWSKATQAHEVHGSIARTYRRFGADASCLGLPISDEEATEGGRVSYFEYGRIVWQQGDTDGRIICKFFSQPRAAVTALEPREDHIDLFATGADGAVGSTWWEPGPAARQETLQTIALDAMAEHRLVVELDNAALAHLAMWDPVPEALPWSLDLCVFLIASSAAAIDAGEFLLALGPNVGAGQAGRYLGRFADLLGSPADRALAEVARAEDAHAPRATWAELVYLPRRLRSANVVVRPAVRDHEIAIGVPPGVSRDRAVPLDELVVGVRDGRFRLRWTKSDTDVVVRAGHMLTNFPLPRCAASSMMSPRTASRSLRPSTGAQRPPIRSCLAS